MIIYCGKICGRMAVRWQKNTRRLQSMMSERASELEVLPRRHSYSLSCMEHRYCHIGKHDNNGQNSGKDRQAVYIKTYRLFRI